MLESLSRRDPIMVANAVVSPSRVSALKIMLGGNSAALHIDTDAQISFGNPSDHVQRFCCAAREDW